jgi:hypothetical protein
VIDPTKNVLDLVSAAVLRADDLRKEDRRFLIAEIKHSRELIRLRSDEQRREVKDIRRLEAMRHDHDKELRLAEAARIDSIRAVDNQAVQQAAQVSAVQATTLAGQVAASAEAMRVQVAATATASATALTNALEPIQKAIDDLRQAQYQQQGEKSQVTESRASAADLEPLLELVRDLTKSRDQAVGQASQVVSARSAWQPFQVAMMSFVGALMVALLILAASGKLH